ncbi:hypothetical protein C8J57DRAFT_201128 [Mycena rebaudengoi]|nr:hypothetical protein C8J57DRAFT_201128 [Mycena rebaudengoi]
MSSPHPSDMDNNAESDSEAQHVPPPLPCLTKKQKKKAAAEKKQAVQHPAPGVEQSEALTRPTPSVLLRDSTETSVSQLSDGRDFPEPCQARLRQNLTAGEMSELVDVGKAYLSYAIIRLFLEALPDGRATKNSLTTIRNTLISKPVRRVLASKFSRPAGLQKPYQADEIFHACLGQLTRIQPEDEFKIFVANLLHSVIGTVSETAAQIQPNLDSVPVDRTHGILKSMHDAEPGRKRRYSPGKENVPPLLGAPVTPPREPKRRRSIKCLLLRWATMRPRVKRRRTLPKA